MVISQSITLRDINIKKILREHYEVNDEKKKTEISDTIFEDLSNQKLEGHDFYEPRNMYEMNITSLLNENSNRYITFLDPNQNSIKMWITMIDFIQGGSLPLRTDKPCWWCRDTFASCPVGVPLAYISNSIKGVKREIIKNNLQKYNLPTDTIDFFETEGIFCSFPCVKAYISDELKKGNILYKDSPTLLTLMIYKLCGKITVVEKAGSWKNIDRWCGHLPINHYRGAMCKLQYTENSNIKRPLMYSIGSYMEEIKNT